LFEVLVAKICSVPTQVLPFQNSFHFFIEIFTLDIQAQESEEVQEIFMLQEKYVFSGLVITRFGFVRSAIYCLGVVVNSFPALSITLRVKS